MVTFRLLISGMTRVSTDVEEDEGVEDDVSLGVEIAFTISSTTLLTVSSAGSVGITLATKYYGRCQNVW